MSGVQPFKSFADTVRGHKVQVRGRNQPNRFSAHVKGKLSLGDNKGEKQNPVIKQSLLSETAVRLPGPAILGGTKVFLAEESPAPPEKACTAQHHASKSATSPVGQPEVNLGLAKAAVVNGGPFSDGFHVEDSPATLDRADLALFHTTRSVLPTELMGSLAETSAEAECHISMGYRAD
ncbi:hypothetical protein CMV_025855 [Castanea mollissima]|uniref:Uncharacterized protein n=1 Tax=Castanea mollissima TaxID=60419 RepID=A0A8J4V4K3_9ROSI|nr:hypothetical protein CMV_025855 [Castanea mollissima]